MKVKKAIKESTLNEATFGDAIETEREAKQAVAQDAKSKKVAQKFDLIGDVEFAPWDGPHGEIEEALDTALGNALDAETFDEIGTDNVLLVGRAGTGKTERVLEWAKQRGLTIESYQVQAIDPTDLGGIIARDETSQAALDKMLQDAISDEEKEKLIRENGKYATRLGNREFQRLDNPNCVLFLDEINRATPEVLGALLTLVQNHKIMDPTAPGGMKVLPFKFTIGAMNPYDPAYDTTKLDMAMRTRFGKVEVEPDPAMQHEYYQKFFGKRLEQAKAKGKERLISKVAGQLQLALHITAHPAFSFDGRDEEFMADKKGEATLNPRTLTEALKACDGTKDDFIRQYLKHCNPDRLEMIEDVLEDYDDPEWEEVDDKANSVFKKYENPFAQKKENNLDKLKKSHILDTITN